MKVSKMKYIVGIDEVGRGPLAGPVCVGGVAILARERSSLARLFRGVKDRKKLSKQQREYWLETLLKVVAGGKRNSSATNSVDIRCLQNRRYQMSTTATIITRTVFVSERLIDRNGMGWALRTAVARVLAKLSLPLNETSILLDGGLKAPANYINQKTIIRGDEKEWLIALASIIAKVKRDRFLVRLARKYPEYGFERHKGYGTKAHYEAIKRYGLCQIHRKSFLKKLQIPNNKFQTISKF